jgi:hypothetical protein
MRKLWYWLGGAALAALTGLAIAQPLNSLTLTGNEAWSIAVGGPGGPSIFTTVSQIRNTTGYVTIAGASVTGTVTIPVNVNRYIITTQPSVATIQLPSAPFDGQMAEVVNGTASAFSTNAVTLNPNTGQTLIGGNITLTTLAAGSSVEVQYSLANTTWYRLR